MTFFVVLPIQNTQNRDGAALQLKLDEVIRSMKNAPNAMLDHEKLSQDDLEQLQAMYAAMANAAKLNALDTGRATGE